MTTGMTPSAMMTSMNASGIPNSCEKAQMVAAIDEHGCYAFLGNPAVKTSIDSAAGGGISDWLGDLGVGLPIELQDDGLSASVCGQHNCPGSKAAVAVTVSGALIAAGLYSEDGDD